MGRRKTEYLATPELAQKAKESREFARLTQQEAAERLGTVQPQISRAEDPDSGEAYNGLRARMCREFGQHECEGPLFRFRRRKLTQ